MKHYYSMKGQFDIFNGFIEKAVQLLRYSGKFGFIIPIRFVMNPDYRLLRELLLNKTKIEEIFDTGEHIFKGVEMPSSILIFSKTSATDGLSTNVIKIRSVRGHYLSGNFETHTIKQSQIAQGNELVFGIYQTEEEQTVVKKIRKCSAPLKKYLSNARGVEIGKKSSLITKKRDFNTVHFLVGEDIGRYYLNCDKFLILGDKTINYKSPSTYEGNKILIRKTGRGINAVLDTKGYYVIQVIYIFKKLDISSPINEKYFLALLNSKLMSFYYFCTFGEKHKKAFPHLKQTQILRLPIRPIDFSNPDDVAMHNQLVQLVDIMLELNRRLQSAPTESDRERIRLQIQSTDRKIDNLVYKLYNITEDEKKIIEGNI